MSNQSQDNQKIDILINLLNFLDCLVPCYTENNGKRYYALVYYCNKKFEPENNNSNDNNNSNNDFVKYKFKGKNAKGEDVDYPIYLHRDTVNKVRGKCEDCNFCDIVNNIVNNYKNFWDEIWNNLNIELITENINDPDSYKEQDGKKKISIYQINNKVPNSVFTLEEDKKCDNEIFIKDGVYIENIDTQSQNQNQQDQNQENKTKQLLELKKLLLTKANEIILKKKSKSKDPANDAKRMVDKWMK